jgi:hypothetical protein
MRDKKTVVGIVSEWLKANGYDGLTNNECGCLLDDLMPCDDPQGNCEAAYKKECTLENCQNGDCGADCDGFKPGCCLMIPGKRPCPKPSTGKCDLCGKEFMTLELVKSGPPEHFCACKSCWNNKNTTKTFSTKEKA